MTWKAIGQSTIGTSHITHHGVCEDAIEYAVINDASNAPVLICCASDGAGSAKHAAYASSFVTKKVVELSKAIFAGGDELSDAHIYAMAEDVCDALEEQAALDNEPLNEYSCTLLGCILTTTRSAFFQIGDGAILRNDNSGFYTPLWWPDNGEYLNTTSFIVDDRSFGNLNISIIDEPVNEVAIITDGLQLLALNLESKTVHQPFFTDLFKYLRLADDTEKINILNGKLTTYLDSAAINNRTDDDKTLFLATRL